MVGTICNTFRCGLHEEHMIKQNSEIRSKVAPVRSAGAWGISVHADEIYPPEAGIEPALALLQRSGVEYTTLRMVNGRDSFMRLDNAEIDAFAAKLKKFGIKIAALDTPVFKCPLRQNNAITWGYSPGFSTDMTLADHYWYLNRAFEIADRLEVEQIRCFAFWREYSFDDAFDEAVRILKTAAAKAGAVGKTLYLQNQPETLAGTGMELARIVKAVKSPYLKAAYDVANSARLGGVPYPDDYRALKGLLGAVQVKFQVIDVRGGSGHPSGDLADPRFPFPPFFMWYAEKTPIEGWVQIEGKRFEIKGKRNFVPIESTAGLDYRPLFEELKKDGYDGLISVDSGYFLPESDITDREIEAGFDKTISSLKNLIGKVWS
jgi:L-ribulose-5-phosphate 3-epimerase